MSACPGCWRPQVEVPPSLDGDWWWCLRCLNKKVSVAIVAALT